MSKAECRKSKSYLVKNLALTLSVVLCACIPDYILLIKSEKILLIKDLQGFLGVYNFRHFVFGPFSTLPKRRNKQDILSQIQNIFFIYTLRMKYELNNQC